MILCAWLAGKQTRSHLQASRQREHWVLFQLYHRVALSLWEFAWVLSDWQLKGLAAVGVGICPKRPRGFRMSLEFSLHSLSKMVRSIHLGVLNRDMIRQVLVQSRGDENALVCSAHERLGHAVRGLGPFGWSTFGSFGRKNGAHFTWFHHVKKMEDWTAYLRSRTLVCSLQSLVRFERSHWTFVMLRSSTTNFGFDFASGLGLLERIIELAAWLWMLLEIAFWQ